LSFNPPSSKFKNKVRLTSFFKKFTAKDFESQYVKAYYAWFYKKKLPKNPYPQIFIQLHALRFEYIRCCFFFLNALEDASAVSQILTVTEPGHVEFIN